jgi:hypothetical protein
LIINIRGKLDFQPRITFFCSIINRPTVTYLLLCSPYFSWLSSHWIWACCWWCDGKRWWCLWSYHEGDDLTLLATSLIFSTCYLWFFFLFLKNLFAVCLHQSRWWIKKILGHFWHSTRGCCVWEWFPILIWLIDEWLLINI